MQPIHVIGDIAGNYLTLQALIKRLPPGKIVSVGDMVDRGQRSKEVLEFFLNDPNAAAVMGNHEHMMLFNYGLVSVSDGEYDSGVWYYNGGTATERSFGGTVPKDILEKVAALPRFLVFEDDNHTYSDESPACLRCKGEFGLDVGSRCPVTKSFKVSHTPARDCSLFDALWDRNEPTRDPEHDLVVFGHNSHWGLRSYKDECGTFAMCIDTSRTKQMTALTLPTMEITQQDYVD